MLALQGTLTIAPFRCISSSMDEHALGSGHVSPSGSMGWRARASTPRQHVSTQPELPPQWADSADTRPSGEKPPSRALRCTHLYYCREFTDQDSPISTAVRASCSPTS